MSIQGSQAGQVGSFADYEANVTSIDGIGMQLGRPLHPTDTGRMPELMETGTSGRYLTDRVGEWAKDSEPDLFDVLYDEAATGYYGPALESTGQGEQFLRLLQKYKPVVAEWAKAALHGEEVNDNLSADLVQEPEGRGQATLRPIQPASLASFSYVNTPGSTGQYDIVSGDTATQNEQAFIIFGYIDPYAGTQTGYTHIQEDVDDSLGVRRPIPARFATEGDDKLAVVERKRGPLLVWPGDTITNISLDVFEPNIKTGLTPLGFEVVTENATEFGSVLD